MFFNHTNFGGFDAKSNCITIQIFVSDCFTQTNQTFVTLKFWAQKKRTGNFLLFPSVFFIGLFLSK